MPENFKEVQSFKEFGGSKYILIPALLLKVMGITETSTVELEFDWATEKIILSVRK